MIQANELRIGNWIFEPECEPYYFQVEEITHGKPFEDYFVVYRKGSIKSSEPHPIPLTEEWLLRFEGVNESSDDDEFHAFDFEYKGIELCKDWESGKFYHINDSALVWLDYVHTFQNLIFALTGEELKQKEG